MAVITLGVDHLERSIAFCRNGLGPPSEGIVGREFEHEDVETVITHAACTGAGIVQPAHHRRWGRAH